MAKFWLVGLLMVLFMPISVHTQDDNTTICAGSLPSRLVIGEQAQVTPGDANRIRDEPSLDAEQIGEIPAESIFNVLAGPVCADNFTWWQVDYNGFIGWTVEGDHDTYWTMPYNTTLNQSGITIQSDNLAQLTALRIIPLDQGGIYRMALRPNSDQIAISRFGIVDIYDLQTGEHQAEITYGDGRGWIHNLVFSPDGELLVISDFSEMPEVWDVNTYELVTILDDYPRDFVMSPREPLLVSFNTSSFTFWDVETGEELLNISDIYLEAFDTTLRDDVETMNFSPDGRLVATGFGGGYVTVLDVEQGEIVAVLVHTTANAELPDDIAPVSGVDFSPDGTTLATIACLRYSTSSPDSCVEAELMFWDTITFDLLNTISISPASQYPGLNSFNPHLQLRYSPDGTLLFITGRHLWVLDTFIGEIIFTRNQTEIDPIRQFTFNENGTQLVSLNGNGVSVLGIP